MTDQSARTTAADPASSGSPGTQGDPATRGVVSQALSDGWVVAQRNLIKIKRVPEVLVFVLISPIMFVLLFAYVFGAAIDVPGDIDYKEFLIGGIFAQTVVFGATFTGAGLAEDMQKGIIDRFRSLPMSRAAVLVGPHRVGELPARRRRFDGHGVGPGQGRAAATWWWRCRRRRG